MRRKAGTLLPIEAAILETALQLRQHGVAEFHGFFIAKEMRDQETARQLTAHGTLYRALGRMEVAGLLASEWEDASIAAEQQRPRRRLYRITGVGELALKQWFTQQSQQCLTLEGGLTSS
jgi:PadR family transcriptional regulator, regulatory protein PadR